MEENGFDGAPSIGIRRKSAFVLDMTLTFDLLTSKCDQFIFVPNCTQAACTFGRIPIRAVCKKIILLTNFQYMFTHGRTREQPEIRMPPAAIA